MLNTLDPLTYNHSTLEWKCLDIWQLMAGESRNKQTNGYVATQENTPEDSDGNNFSQNSDGADKGQAPRHKEREVLRLTQTFTNKRFLKEKDSTNFK